MASNNRLLGSGKTYSEEEVVQILENFDPVWLFHKDHPEGQIVKKQVVFDQLIKEGWVDHPGKCTLLPGLEKYYEGDKEIEEVEKVKEPEETEKVEEGAKSEGKTVKQKKLFKE